MEIALRVKKYIAENSLLLENSEVIVGVSGGADSIALLHILKSLGNRCVVAHCNFHLRGDESDRDELFVTNFCKKNNLEYKTVSFDTYAYMEEKKISLEMAARELRYNWFEEISLLYGINKIAIAHHQDDSAETVLINLIRGSGIKGLTGISPQNGKIIRPLLCITRKEVIKYLQNNQLSYVDDSTNAEDIYLRNKLRLNIIPELEKINPSVTQTIHQTSIYLSQVEKIYNRYIETTIKEVYVNNRIDISKLQKTEAPKAILFEILYPLGYNSTNIDNIFDSIDEISGKIFYSEKYILVKDRLFFIINEKKQEDNNKFFIEKDAKQIDYPLKLTFNHLEKDSNFKLEKNKNKIFVNESKLTYPLQIRKWQRGDKFIPFGMKGSKKVSDFFTDNKYSIIDKQNTWILCDNNDNILWIVGERADNRFKITETTRSILEIELIPE